jgi:hypothetical protein
MIYPDSQNISANNKAKKGIPTVVQALLAIAVFIILSMLFYGGPIFKAYEGLKQLQLNIERDSIFLVGDLEAIRLESLYRLTNKYPSVEYFESTGELIRNYNAQKGLDTQLEKNVKKYLKRDLTEKDFTYESDGQSYRLCLNAADLHRCWKSSLGNKSIVE